jgi:hypothetical protein
MPTEGWPVVVKFRAAVKSPTPHAEAAATRQ